MPLFFTANNLPTRAELCHDEATVLTGNALVVTVDTGQIDNHFARQSTSADGNSFTQSVFLRAGSYTFSVLGETNTANGYLVWYLDGAVIGTFQDWYSVSLTKNVIQTIAVTIANDGYHTLKGVVTGKSGSSSGFNIDLTRYWFRMGSD